MEVTDITATTPTISTENTGITEVDQSDEMSDFLILLTAQIENQDPLEPLDANQFVEQLAMINSLEQQIETNDNLEEVIDILRTNIEDSA